MTQASKSAVECNGCPGVQMAAALPPSMRHRKARFARVLWPCWYQAHCLDLAYCCCGTQAGSYG